MQSFKKYFREYITGMFPAASPTQPDQTIRTSPLKLSQPNSFENYDANMKPIQASEIKTLIIHLLNKFIKNSLDELRIEDLDNSISLVRKDLSFIDFNKDFDYVNGKVIINFQVNHLNDEVLDLLDDLKLIEQKYDIIFNRATPSLSIN